MKRLIWIFVILLIAIGIGFLVQRDSGYVLISYAHWSLETSLWFALIAVILLFFIFHYLLRLLKHTRLLGGRLRQWDKARKQEKARRLTNLGLCELAEGKWQKAEENLLQAAADAPTPLINYLSAARAAQAQQAFNRRDQHLQQAHQFVKGGEFAIGLTQAQLQIESKQWEQALATLKHLHKHDARHNLILQLLQTVYYELQDWQQLKALLPALKKNNLLASHEYEQLALAVYSNLLKQATTLSTLNEIWQDPPKNLRENSAILLIYTQQLMNFAQPEKAAAMIEEAMKKCYCASLVQIYTQLNIGNGAKQLATIEKWLDKYPNEYVLLNGAAELALREKFLGKAKAYLQESVQLKSQASTYHLLAIVYEELGEHDQAWQCLRLRHE